MRGATILFAENDMDFLNTRSEFLKQEGYRVIPAKDFATARRLLERGGIDLAIIDIRLENDDDERDESGLILAREVSRSTPKIILTNFPTADTAVDMLKTDLDGLPAALEYVDKKDGYEVLIHAVYQVLGPGTTWLRQVEQAIAGTDGQLEQDHDSAQGQFSVSFIVSLCVAVIGVVVVFAGVALALSDLVAAGVASTIGGIVIQAVSYLFFNRADRVNARMDRYHEERIEGQRFNTLLQACEGLSSEPLRESCRERVIMAAARNWLGEWKDGASATPAASSKKPEASGDA